MKNTLPIARTLMLALALCLAAAPAQAYDSCRASDFDGSGSVDISDLVALVAVIGQASPRIDLDGNGVVGDADIAIFTGVYGQFCFDCRADLDGDFDVDAADRTALEAAYARDCRPDLNRDDSVGQLDVDVMGEYFGQAAAPGSAEARADLDGNGVVDLVDLAALGQATGRDCRPDLNKDGAVDTNDLWALLSSWGSCL